MFQNVIAGLNIYIFNADERRDNVAELADYLRESIKHTTEHRLWAVKFFLCECLNLLNVIAQIFITDAFLGGEFTQYGVEVKHD